MPAEGRENPLLKKGNSDAFFREKYLTKNSLGISANTLFDPEISDTDEKIQRFIGKFQSCSPENRQILLNTLDYLAEQLLALQNHPESKNSE